jgi:hypothetical protein
MQFSPHEPRNIPERVVSLIPKVCTRALYPTSDIRFVMVELGKLGTKVDRLISDVEAQGTKIDAQSAKIDAVCHQISFAKGALSVFGAFFCNCDGCHSSLSQNDDALTAEGESICQPKKQT